MSKPCDPIELLKKAAVCFSRQEDFVEAARSAYSDMHAGIRPGPQSKVNVIKIFKAITQFQLTQVRKTKSLPSTNSIARYINATFKFSLSRARVYVRIWRLWYWRGVALLTPRDHAWLEKNYPIIAKDFFSKRWLRTPASIRRHSSRTKALQDSELDRLIGELVGEVWRLQDPPQKSVKGKLLTRKDVLRLLDDSRT